MIYFDQAASSFPTLPTVIDQMVYTMEHVGANPGRGTHALGVEASEIVERSRRKAKQLFQCEQTNQCLFFSSATVGLNQAILGFPWEKGDHVIATTMEHNAVRRPLEVTRKNKEIDVTYVEWTDDVQSFIKKVSLSITPQTKMVILTHASNITGEILPIKEVCELFAENTTITTVVDASQTAGHIPIQMTDDHIDMLVFPAHKGLRGPQGIGMLLVNKTIDLQPIHYGGTGGQSISIEPPIEWPYRFEAGTLNVPAIAGLYAALSHMENHIEENVSRETKLMDILLQGLCNIDGITIYGATEREQMIPVVAWNIKGVHSEEVALILDTHYQIAVRAGLHCNVLGHKALRTVEQGVIRISINTTNTEQEIAQLLTAVREITQSYTA